MEWLLAVELVFVALSLSGSGWDDIPVSSHHVPPSHIYKLMEWFYLYILAQVMLTVYKLLGSRSPRALHSGCREYTPPSERAVGKWLLRTLIEGYGKRTPTVISLQKC